MLGRYRLRCEVINAMALAEVIARWGCLVVGLATSGEEAIR